MSAAEDYAVEMTITTTTSHRREVVEGAIDALHDLALVLAQSVKKNVENVHVIEARSKITQLDKALEALTKAQYLHHSLTQGETKNED